jgi:ribosomal protein S21
MANATRVRVELKSKYNDPQKNFKEMFQEFKRNVSNAGILHDYKDHQTHTTRSEKKRKKKREAIKKHRQEQLERKILSGERVKAPSGVIKKVLSNQKKDKRKGRGSYGKK